MPCNEKASASRPWKRRSHVFTILFIGCVFTALIFRNQRSSTWCLFAAVISWIGAAVCDRRARRREQAEHKEQFDANAERYPELLLTAPDWEAPEKVPDGTLIRVFDGRNGDWLCDVSGEKLRVLLAWVVRTREFMPELKANDCLLMAQDLELMEVEGRGADEIGVFRKFLAGRDLVVVHWIPIGGVSPAG